MKKMGLLLLLCLTLISCGGGPDANTLREQVQQVVLARANVAFATPFKQVALSMFQQS